MACLRVFDQDNGFWDIPLKKKRVIIGSDKNYSDSIIRDPCISKMHSMIFEDGGHYFIKDLDSSGGTFVNQRPVTETALPNGATIRLGQTLMTFMLNERTDRPVPSDPDDRAAAGLYRRFLAPPPDMGLNVRRIFSSCKELFHTGDTLIVGSGGLSIPNIPPLNIEESEDIILELELIWPDGNKKNFVGEVIAMVHGQLGIKLHRINTMTYARILQSCNRGSWINVYKPKYIAI